MPSLSALSRCILVFVALASAQASDTRWWPEQKTPKTLLIIDAGQFAKLGAAHGGEDSGGTIRPVPTTCWPESLSGLGRAGGERRPGRRIDLGRDARQQILCRMAGTPGETHRHDQKKSTDLWQTVSDYAQRGIVKGYILYNHELVTRDDRRKPSRPMNPPMPPP